MRELALDEHCERAWNQGAAIAPAAPLLPAGRSPVTCSSLPGLKRTALPGVMLTSVPVRGLRPMPVLRARTLKTPNPRSSMRSPAVRACFQALEDRIHRGLSLGAGQARALDHMMDDVLFNQCGYLAGATESTVLRPAALMLQILEGLWNTWLPAIRLGRFFSSAENLLQGVLRLSRCLPAAGLHPCPLSSRYYFCKYERSNGFRLSQVQIRMRARPGTGDAG